MRVVRSVALVSLFMLMLSCSKGGPLTPSESFKLIRAAANKNDYNVVLANLSSGSIGKIEKFMAFSRELNEKQAAELSGITGIPAAKLKSLKPADCIAIYFSSDMLQVNLRNIINEEIIAVDVDGSSATVKTSGGFDLDFVREGPYWKLDISRL